MALQINGITLLTRAPAKMRAFYERVPNQKGDGNNTHVVFELGGGTLVLWRASNLEELLPNAMQNAGISFITEPHGRPEWGIRTAHFRDPDGNLLEIFERLQP